MPGLRVSRMSINVALALRVRVGSSGAARTPDHWRDGGLCGWRQSESQARPLARPSSTPPDVPTSHDTGCVDAASRDAARWRDAGDGRRGHGECAGRRTRASHLPLRGRVATRSRESHVREPCAAAPKGARDDDGATRGSRTKEGALKSANRERGRLPKVR